MICPKLSDLPSPPVGKTGWPWTEESEHVFSFETGEPLPKISIVTPTYNQSNYIEETIRSVLLQGYPDLEYIICDGGSSDGTVEILKKYSPWISFWVSESDKGQSDAINKGFKRSAGDIAAWINSDDLYEKGAFNLVAQAFIQHPDYGLFYGDCLSFSDAGEHSILVRPHKTYSRKLLLQGQYFQQPSAFFNRISLTEIGYIDENFHFCMDYDLFFRLCEGYAVTYIPETLARFRYQTDSKTVSQNYKFLVEIILILDNIIQSSQLDNKCMSIALNRIFWSGLKISKDVSQSIDINSTGVICGFDMPMLSSKEWAIYFIRETDNIVKTSKNMSQQNERIYKQLIERYQKSKISGERSGYCCASSIEIIGYTVINKLISSGNHMLGLYSQTILTYYPDLLKYRWLIIIRYICGYILFRKRIWEYK